MKKIKKNFFLKFFKKSPKVLRRTIITQKMLGKYFSVHNGKDYVRVLATTARLGTKFGEYSFTRKDCVHSKKKKKKK